MGRALVCIQPLNSALTSGLGFCLRPGPRQNGPEETGPLGFRADTNSDCRGEEGRVKYQDRAMRGYLGQSLPVRKSQGPLLLVQGDLAMRAL